MSLGGTIEIPSLNLIPQGTTESNRIGRKCTIKSISVKGSVQMAVSDNASQADQRYRMIWYLDKQTNGAEPTVLDILETASINSFRNLANSSRFRVLRDVTKNCPVSATGVTAVNAFTTLSDQWTFRFNKRCNIPLEFSGTTGVITELRSNNIGMLAITQTADRLPSFGFTARVRFSDN